MKMKSIITLAAFAFAATALAFDACASTNYCELASKRRNCIVAVKDMSRDSGLADAAAFRTALETVDRSLASGDFNCTYMYLTRCMPMTARAVLDRCGDFSERAKSDMLAVCGYDAENRTVELDPGEAGYVNFAFQSACTGSSSVNGIRNRVLNAAVVPTRRMIRAAGGTFVGPEGAKAVKAELDALAAELNAPRFGNAGAVLARMGLEVEWDFVQSKILTDDEVAAVRERLLGGETQFSAALQNQLCIALGVTAYNEFVREYNGK